MLSAREGDLRRVFLHFAAEHQESIGRARVALGKLSTADVLPGAVLGDITRAFRESRLSASYLGLSAASEVAEQAGQVIAQVEQWGRVPGPRPSEALAEALDFVSGELEAACGRASAASPTTTRAVLRRLSICTVPEGPEGESEDEDLALFVADARRLVTDFSGALAAALATGKGHAAAQLDAAFRALHTLKGNAGMMGLAPLEALAGAAEHTLASVRGGQVQLTPELRAAQTRGLERAICMLVGDADEREHAPAIDCCEPLTAVLRKAQKAALDASRRLHKSVHVELVGGEVAAPVIVLEALGDALVHLVRNAVDHGAEPPGERIARGKPPLATLRVTAHRAGDVLSVEVYDDGRGLHRAHILQKALERELVDAHSAATLPDDAVYAFVFEPGFSTATHLSGLSGRGVGMDAARHAIMQVRGEIAISSKTGDSTTVRLTIPCAGHVADTDSNSAAERSEFRVTSRR